MCLNTEQAMNSEKETIPQFFAGKNVFITGATGFVGKALMEKLMRSCPDVGTIYILIRPKRGKTLRERLTKLLDNCLFDQLKSEQPSDFLQSRIHVIPGDIAEIDLGISKEDENLLLENVNVVFHAAATVNFNEPLSVATKLNLRATRDLCRMALKMKQLHAYVHVSTAYANCNQITSEEKLYPPSYNWKELITLTETMESDALEKLLPTIQKDFPNTYCLTKNLAEHCVNELCNNKIPVVVYRPSIVQYMVKADPLVGWTDNFNALNMLLLGYSSGIIRSVVADLTIIPNVVPIDMVTKSLVVSAWDIATHKKKSVDIAIVHCTSDGIDWLRSNSHEFYKHVDDILRVEPVTKAAWTPNCVIFMSKYLAHIYTFFFMILPSYFADLLLMLAGRKTRFYNYVNKARQLMAVTRFFLTNTFYFTNTKFYEMRNRIPRSDLKAWDIDYHDLQTKYEFMRLAAFSTRKYLLNVPDSQIDEIRNHNNRMYWVDFALKSVICLVIFYYLFQYLFL